MSDSELGLTGKDVTVEMMIDGLPLGLNGKVTDFSETPRFATNTRRHLGTTQVDIDKIPAGWEGTFEITSKDGSVEDALDAWRLARANRVPISTQLAVVRRYRNQTSRTHVYQCVQWEMETNVQRDESMVHRFSWESGFERITLPL